MVAGAAAAYAADRFPAHTRILETVGGVLLITGLALVGFGLPYVPN